MSEIEYPMGELSAIYKINHCHLTAGMEELVSNALLVKYGVTLFGGREKEKKTFLLLQLSLCCANGEPFLCFSTKQGNVLYVVCEGGEEYLLDRLEVMAKSLYPQSHRDVLGKVAVKEMVGLEIDKGYGGILQVAKNLPSPVSYLIIDPVDLAISGDYSNPEIARPAMQNLYELSRQLQCGVIASTHFRKSSTKKGFDVEDIIGSKLWTAMASAIWQIKTEAGYKLFKAEVRYGPPLDNEIALTFDEDSLVFKTVEPLLSAGAKAKEEILRVLKESKGQMLWKELKNEVRKRTGVHLNTIDTARHRLEAQKKIKTERVKGSVQKHVILL